MKLILTASELDTVPVKTRPTEAKAARMDYDFEVAAGSNAEPLVGKAGQYVVIQKDGSAEVLSERKFRDRYARVIVRKAAVAATGA